MAKNLGYNLYRKFKSTLENYIEDYIDNVLDNFCAEDIISTDKKRALLKQSQTERIQTLKNIMKSKSRESDQSFAAILSAFSSIKGIDMKNITAEFEREQQKLHTQQTKQSKLSAKSRSSEVFSHAQSSSAFTQPAGQAASPTTLQPNSSTHARRLDSHVPALPTIQGSPHISTKHSYVSDEHHGPRTVTSASYPVAKKRVDQLPIEDSNSMTIPQQETNSTHTRYPKSGRQLSMSESDPNLKSEDKYINEFSTLTSQSVEMVRACLDQVEGRCKHLASHYQIKHDEMDQEIKNLKVESRRSSLIIEKLESDLQEKDQQQESDKEQLKERLSEEEKKVCALKEQLRDAETALQNTKHKLANVLKIERKGVEDKMEIVKELDKLIAELSGKPGDHDEKVLEDIQLRIHKLKNRDRPSTTGGVRNIRQ